MSTVNTTITWSYTNCSKLYNYKLTNASPRRITNIGFDDAHGTIITIDGAVYPFPFGVSYGALFRYRNDITDANTNFLGFVYCSNNRIANCLCANGLLISFGSTTNIGVQLFIGYQNVGFWYRDITNDTTRQWVQL